MYIALLFAILLAIVVLAFFEDEKMQSKTWLLFALASLLTLCAAFRPEGVDKDYMSYLGYYANPNSSMAVLAEPTFKLICSIARFFGYPLLVFVIYALLAVPLKFYSIVRLTPLWYMSILVWFTHLYIVQDLTQIRVAVASAIYLFSLPFLIDGRKWRYLLCIVVAILFHYSALFLLPILVFGNKPMVRWKWMLLYILPLLFYFTSIISIELLYYIPIPFIQKKIVVYEEMIKYSDMFSELNKFNIMALFRLFAYYMLLWKCNVIAKVYPNMSIVLKIMCYSICVYAGLSFFPVFAVRAQELIGVIDFVALPLLALAFRPNWLGRLAVIVYVVGVFIADLFLYDYLRFDV